jgi:ubiquinone/menaquinone biosynthesis C-methylase UbiE
MLAEVCRCLHQHQIAAESILDVGCATGDFTELLRRLLPENAARRLVGMDLSETAIERARSRYPHVEFCNGQIDQLPQRFADAFDVICCLEVLYYLKLEQRELALESVRLAMRQGGLLLVSAMTGKPPYVNHDELRAMVARHFQIIAGGRLTLWPLTQIEKVMLSTSWRVPRVSIERFVAGRRGFKVMQVLSRMCRVMFGRHAQSHSYVLALRQ